MKKYITLLIYLLSITCFSSMAAATTPAEKELLIMQLNEGLRLKSAPIFSLPCSNAIRISVSLKPAGNCSN